MNWKESKPTTFDATSPSKREVATAEAQFSNVRARYIKVSAVSPKKLPEWHEYKGEDCWIFADELIVE